MSPQATIIVVCIISLLLGSTQTQTSSEIDPILNEGKSCGLNKECVPRYLCDEKGNVIKSGAFGIEGRNNFVDITAQGECSFLEVCCNVGNKLTEPEPIKPSSEGCGYRNRNGVGFKIKGDKASYSQFAEFPWMVAIMNNEVYKCGGAVIAPNVVLTAAHRLKNLEPQNLIARAGEWDMRTENELLPHQDARVKEIVRHEKFDRLEDYNDVALLILEKHFNWTENVRPICLPAPNANFDYLRCYATGWGKDKFSEVDLYHLILKKRELRTVSHDTCQAQLRRSGLGESFNLDPSFMCAGGERGTSMCIGDGGSPLVCPDPRNPERYYQAGIMSWGITRGKGRFPQIFASVPYLRNWINAKLSARGISHFTM